MKKWIHFKTVSVLLIGLTGLAGCGGGGDSDSGSGGNGNSTTPSVNAGIDQTVNEQLGATVSATGFPDGGTYSWTQTGGPILAAFPSSEQSVSITAPTVKVAQTISLKVEYTTTSGQIVTDAVNIDVVPVNRAPVAIATMTSPAANPIAPESTVILDATASFDNDADGVITSYKWVQGDDSPAVSQLNGDDDSTFEFVAPQVSEATAFDFTLTVTDDEGASSDYDITVNVDPMLTVIDVDGGADRVVNEQQSITLTAVGDPDGGSYTWTQLTGDGISSFPASTASVEFVTPATKSVKNFEFRVQYQSPTGFVDYDQVRVTVNPVNLQPTALIRVLTPAILPAQPNVTVTLDGTGSTDSDGTIVEYAWAQVSGAVSVVPQSSSSDAEYVFTAPVRQNPESYVFMLTVTDDEGGQGTFEIEIDVEGTSDLIVADAGVDQVVDEFTTVQLDGTGSYSIVSAVTCSWQALTGPTVSFNNPNSCNSSFVAPNVDTNTDMTMQLTVTNSQGDTATDTTKITVKPVALGFIADSGQTQCYNQSEAIPCGDVSYPRQDAESGRDSVEQYLDKVGTGEAGFDYTKLDVNGDELPDDSTDYYCVRDNFTGLIWERKTTSTNGVPNTTLQDNKNSYTWFLTSDNGSTGGEDGTAATAQTICPSATDCGLETYVTEVNAQIYCGASNWRVPTMLELQSLVNYSKGENEGVIDNDIFGDLPNSGLLGHLYYWASETTSEGGVFLSAWALNFTNGNDNALPKSSNAYVRLVRTP